MDRGSTGGLSAAALTLLAAAAIGGCGNSAPSRAGAGRGELLKPMPVGRLGPMPVGRLGPMPLDGGAALSVHPPARLSQGTLPRVGATQHVDASGARLAVTLRRLIDPLRGSGAELPPRTRAVAVIMQIHSSGPKLYDSSATGDIRVVASSGVVTPVLATRGACRTPRDDFDRYITAGEDRVGCVVFAVANGATLDAVWFSPHAHRAGRLTWAP